YVRGSGGGGSTYNGYGNTSAIRINTTVSVKQEFFLKPETGNQIPVKLSDEDIPLTDGQNVTMVSGHAGDKAEWTHLINHNAALYWKLGKMLHHVIVWGLVRKPSLIFWAGVIMWVAVGYMFSGLLGFIVAVVYWTYEGMNMRKVAKALENHLDGLGREMLASRPASS
ncbi:MAG TPA: hypothetical protein VIN36_06440, partial [Thiobacillus sp.]